MTGQFTGRHAAAIFVAFFGVVAAVNLTMARLASSTFGGVVVRNSYVASQNFNRWLDQANAEKALGWKATAVREADNRLTVSLSGVPEGAQVTAIARHPLGREPDQALAFSPLGEGRFRSTATLPATRWQLRLQVRVQGKAWNSEAPVR
jgi:nitrogen fixation protein FixH